MRTQIYLTRVKVLRTITTATYTKNFFKMQLFIDLELDQNAWKPSH